MKAHIFFPLLFTCLHALPGQVFDLGLESQPYIFAPINRGGDHAYSNNDFLLEKQGVAFSASSEAQVSFSISFETDAWIYGFKDADQARTTIAGSIESEEGVGVLLDGETGTPEFSVSITLEAINISDTFNIFTIPYGVQERVAKGIASILRMDFTEAARYFVKLAGSYTPEISLRDTKEDFFGGQAIFGGAQNARFTFFRRSEQPPEREPGFQIQYSFSGGIRHNNNLDSLETERIIIPTADSNLEAIKVKSDETRWVGNYEEFFEIPLNLAVSIPIAAGNWNSEKEDDIIKSSSGSVILISVYVNTSLRVLEGWEYNGSYGYAATFFETTLKHDSSKKTSEVSSKYHISVFLERENAYGSSDQEWHLGISASLSL